MGGKCCGLKAKKRSKKAPDQIKTNLQVDIHVVYSDSRYFKRKQQLFYNEALLEEMLPSEIKAPMLWESAEIIGQGSFGRVLFGIDKTTENLLAIKEIPLISIKNLSEVTQEVEILSQLNHPNIVRYLGTHTSHECLLIFMEYISGGTISSLLSKHGKFNESLIRIYIYQVLRGLEYLHYHNIAHRDIKGTNILVSPEGICKLADFGSAKQLLGLESTSSVTGTNNWMAPEIIQVTGHGRFADIWSIGCLVIEMATGKPPWYELGGEMNVFMQVCYTQIVPTLPQEFSAEALDFVSQCFQRKPQDRPNVFELLQHPFVNTIEKPEFFRTDSTRFMSDIVNNI